MKNTIFLRLMLLAMIGFGLFQVSACDQITAALDQCDTTETDEGGLSIGCNPDGDGEET